MKHETVKSSQVHSTAHDGASTLEMRFRCSCPGNPSCPKCLGTGHTGTYSYANVPPEIHARIRAGEIEGSVGKTFNALVKKAGFKFTFTPNT